MTPLMRIVGVKSLKKNLTYIRHHGSLESPRPGPLVPMDRRPLRQGFHQIAEFDPKEDMHRKTLLRRKGIVRIRTADDREHE